MDLNAYVNCFDPQNVSQTLVLSISGVLEFFVLNCQKKLFYGQKVCQKVLRIGQKWLLSMNMRGNWLMPIKTVMTQK